MGKGRSPWEEGAVREKSLINVTSFWVILMANVKDTGLTGGLGLQKHTHKHMHEHSNAQSFSLQTMTFERRQ